jgi:hypothetical protein
MSGPPLDELYFTWLYSKVGSVEDANPSRTYWALTKKLFTKEFVWFVPNDDNRAEDGRDLRREFLEEEGIASIDEDWLRLGCSMFELLIGLSRRLEFEAGGTPKDWFWTLIRNLGMELCNDASPLNIGAIDEAIDVVIWRTYRSDGHGGLFPLRQAREDQRKVELWYQLCAYLLEKGY